MDSSSSAKPMGALEGLIVGALLLLCLYVVRGLRSPLRHVPGPWHTRFTSLALKWATITGRRMHFIHNLHQVYGAAVRISPTEVDVADPDAYRKIHAINSGFNKAPWYAEFTGTSRPGVFVMADPKMHAARRRLLARPFSKSHLRAHWEDVVLDRVNLAVSRVKELGKFGAVDVLQWWTFMASDISTHLMFGEDFQTLEHGRPSDYITTLTSTMKGSGIGVELPLVRWIGQRLPLKACRMLWQGQETLSAYGQAAVANMKANGGTTNIFANVMAEAEKGEKLDDEDVRSEAQNLIVAGTDTTSISLTYLVYAVLSRPELQHQVEAEVHDLSDGFRDSDVERLELLNAVVNETLRLFGAAAGGLPRVVPEQGLQIGSIFLPSGTVVSTQTYTMHRLEELFPRPLEFLPDRWFEDRDHIAYRVTPAAEAVFAPFGTGSRGCLGIHLAQMELRLAAATFFRECKGARLAPSATPKSMEMENYFLIAPAGHKCEIYT